MKTHGGFTLAQAEFDETAMQGMPTNVAATGLVDHVVRMEAMPAKLIAHQAQLSAVSGWRALADVFHDVWRRAARYDAANGTVLGWVMNQARTRAIDRLRFEGRKKRSVVSLAEDRGEQAVSIVLSGVGSDGQCVD